MAQQAAARRRGKRKGETPRAPAHVRVEIPGILVAASTLLLFLALVSYRPPQGTTLASDWIGPAGATLADALYFMFGLGAYSFVFVGVASAVTLLLGRKVFQRLAHGVGAFLFVVFGSTLLATIAPRAEAFGHLLGGLLGDAGATLIGGLIGSVGAVVVSMAMLLVATVLVTELRVAVLARRFWARVSLYLPEFAGGRTEDARARYGSKDQPRRRLLAPIGMWFGRMIEARRRRREDRLQERQALAADADKARKAAVEADAKSVDIEDARSAEAPIRTSKRAMAAVAAPVEEPVAAENAGRRTASRKKKAGAVAPVEEDLSAAGGRDWLKEPVAGVPASEAVGAADAEQPAAEASIRDRVRARIKQSRARGEASAVGSVELKKDHVPPGSTAGDVAPNPSMRRAPRAGAEAAPTPATPQPDELPQAADTAVVNVVPAEVFDASEDVDVHETPTIPIALKSAAADEAREEADGPKIVESDAQKQRKSSIEIERAARQNKRRVTTSDEWSFPPLKFLQYVEPDADRIDEDALKRTAANLEAVLADFRVEGRVTGICPGPVVTRYEYEPEAGTKISRISGLSDDVAMRLRAEKVRIIAPIPGKGCVGFEIPNDSRETVYLKEVLADDKFTKSKSKLTVALGKDIEGFPIVANLAKMPHLLVAGTTGSGKSVSVNAMITSILYNATPDEVRMILIDPKQLEFAVYEDIPHLLLPVVTDPSKAAQALQWAVLEMDRRYKLMKDLKVRNIAGYNDKLHRLEEKHRQGRLLPGDDVADLLSEVDDDGRPTHRHMPYIMVIVDEFADLMMVSGKEVEIAVARLAQKARAAGIHCILATQRPSVDVLTGLIKANFPTRMSFRLMSGTDSRTVLDTMGAENLLGMGDMLFRPPGRSDLVRVHGAFVDEDEIEQVVDYVKAQRAPDYDESILAAASAAAGATDEPVDDMYDQAVECVCDAGYASISMIQRKLRIGYNRAARIMDEMEAQGIVSPASGGSARREVLAGSFN